MEDTVLTGIYVHTEYRTEYIHIWRTEIQELDDDPGPARIIRWSFNPCMYGVLTTVRIRWRIENEGLFPVFRLSVSA